MLESSNQVEMREKAIRIILILAKYLSLFIARIYQPNASISNYLTWYAVGYMDYYADIS